MFPARNAESIRFTLKNWRKLWRCLRAAKVKRRDGQSSERSRKYLFIQRDWPMILRQIKTIPPFGTLIRTKHFHTVFHSTKLLLRKHSILWSVPAEQNPLYSHSFLSRYDSLSPSLRIAFMFTQDSVSITAGSGRRG